MIRKPARILPRKPGPISIFAALVVSAASQTPASAAALAQRASSDARTLLEVIQAGGIIGYAIIFLSMVGLALVIDAFMRVRDDRLVPPILLEKTTNQARSGQFKKMLSTSQEDDSLLGRILSRALPEGAFGLEALREAVQQEGEKQVTRLRQRVGYIGLIASVAPVLGLLGTVIGMIRSFQVLGESRGAARPDQLAVGISEALITTCMGLILAVPMLFFHTYFRDRVTRIGQEAASACDRILRLMALNLSQRQNTTSPAQAQPSAAPRPAAIEPASAPSSANGPGAA